MRVKLSFYIDVGILYLLQQFIFVLFVQVNVPILSGRQIKDYKVTFLTVVTLFQEGTSQFLPLRIKLL